MCWLICQEHWFPNQDNQKEEIIFSANQVQDIKKIDRKVSCVAFPALAFSCLPAVIAGSMISCSLHHLHVLPPLARVASFPAHTCFLSFRPFTCFPAIYTIYALLSSVTVSYFPTSQPLTWFCSKTLIGWYITICENFCVSFPLGPDQL